MLRLVNGHVALGGGALIAAGGMVLVHYGRTVSRPPYPGIPGTFPVVVHPYSAPGIAVLVVGLAVTVFGIVAVMWPFVPRGRA